MSNSLLKIIKERRSNFRFNSTPIKDEQLNLVLEAGRWAPSWANTQPWRFIVIKDNETKEKICSMVMGITNINMKDAPVCIAVCVNTKEDPFHFIEDGAAATQNMALAAQSTGLGSCWLGVFSLHDEKKSTERKIKQTLKIPDHWRLISLLPVGIPKIKETKSRKELSNILDLNSFTAREEKASKLDIEKKKKPETKKFLSPSSAREIEPALL
jgi:nitroreductase